MTSEDEFPWADSGQQWERFHVPGQSLDDRVESLLVQLTLDEKISFLHCSMPAVPRLGLQPFHLGNEVLHGVAWLGPATVFPQAVGLGATWNDELLERVGAAIGDEARGFHARDRSNSLNVWGPVVNLLRDPRWGRNDEGYSEDPILTASLATAFCRGLRGAPAHHDAPLKTSPVLKHFLAYNNETARGTCSAGLRPRVLHEYDIRPFELTIKAGVVSGVMPSYNKVNGRPNHVSSYLALLRAWQPHLVVVADAFGPTNLVARTGYYRDRPHAVAAQIRAGLDSFNDHGADSSITLESIHAAIGMGLLGEDDIDVPVRRLIRLRLAMSEFDPPGVDRYAAITEQVIACPEHARLARETAGQAMVLLKNDADLLPLDATSAATIAVIGPHSDEVHEDWYSGTMPYRRTALDGIRETFPEARVTHVKALDRIALSTNPDTGFLAVGDGPGGATLHVGTDHADPAQQFDICDWGSDIVTFRSVGNGRYLSLRPEDETAINNMDRPGGWVIRETFRLVPEDDRWFVQNVSTQRYLRVEGGTVAFRADRRQDATPLYRHDVRVGVADAATAAAAADVAVVLVGNYPFVNGSEGQDRTDIGLPPGQEALIRAAVGANAKTVAVVVSGYPMGISWSAANAPAILWSSHGGQEFGTALADVLSGRRPPAGRLPQTWHRHVDDLGDLFDYDIIKSGQTYLYAKREPLFPFGHGLTYVPFRYSALKMSATTLGPDEQLTVAVDVANAGDLDSDEVVQLYVGAPGRRTPRPQRELRGYRRVAVAASTTQTVTFTLHPDELRFWDVDTDRFQVEPGEYQVMVGRSSVDIRSTATVTVLGDPLPPRDLSRGLIRAANFDDYHGIQIIDESPVSGDAVQALVSGAWLQFRDVDLNRPLTTLVARLGQAGPVSGELELRVDDPVNGTLLARLPIPDRTGPYSWLTVSGPITAEATGRRDVYLTFTAPARIASFVLVVAERGTRG